MRNHTHSTEVNGPAATAAETLADRGFQIADVTGSNGCDFKNETADEYLVDVVHLPDTPTSVLYKLNFEILTAYHVGDHDHYLATLRHDTRQALRHYVSESATDGTHPLFINIKSRKVIDTAMADLDKLIHDMNFGGSK